MKKLSVIFAVLFILSIGSSQFFAKTAMTDNAPPDENRTVVHDRVCVDVSTNEDGFYSLMSDVEIHYYKGNIEYIVIDDPTLLAFQVSSAYKGGVWMLDLEEGQLALDELTAAAEALRNDGEDALAEKIEKVIDILDQSGPFTKAST